MTGLPPCPLRDTVSAIIPEYADPDAARPSSDITVYDGLDSTSTTDALSANQGRVLNDKIETYTGSETFPSGITGLGFTCKKSGKTVTLNGAALLSSAVAGKNAVIVTLPAKLRPSSDTSIFLYTTYGGNAGMYHFTVKTNGEIVTNIGFGNASNIVIFCVSFCI